MRHILVATDGSAGAERAVDFAAELAKDTDSTLFIVTVSGDVAAADVQALARVGGGLGEAPELISNQILEQAKQRRGAATFPKCKPVSRGARRPRELSSRPVSTKPMQSS